MDFEQTFNQFKEQSISGRYLTLDMIMPILEKLNTNNELSEIGRSVLHEPIIKYQIGVGNVKVFLWSQMHGNESTTTKGLIDFLNFLKGGSALAVTFLETFTICAIPILNPDGARKYTRVNANNIDLNRDSQTLTQPESKVLRTVFESFKPDYCFNLHDQRTIFGVANTGKSATMSFLAPAYNENRDVNENRLKAINIIAEINNVLQKFIPGQVGRFDDGFNINCIGDTFQSMGVPTVLFEAGHYPLDYQREITRKYVFISLITAFKVINENDIVFNRIEDYLIIPQNEALFYDFLYKNIKISCQGIEKITTFAAQYNEVLIEDSITFEAYISKIDNLDNFFGHIEYNAKNQVYIDENGYCPILNKPASFSIGEKLSIINGLLY